MLLFSPRKGVIFPAFFKTTCHFPGSPRCPTTIQKYSQSKWQRWLRMINDRSENFSEWPKTRTRMPKKTATKQEQIHLNYHYIKGNYGLIEDMPLCRYNLACVLHGDLLIKKQSYHPNHIVGKHFIIKVLRLSLHRM